MRFEWDPEKSRRNRDKHGLSFEDAATLLAGDADWLEAYDLEHSDAEDRFIAVGPVRGSLIVVIYTERPDDVFRILSARRASRREQERYEKYRRGYRP